MKYSIVTALTQHLIGWAGADPPVQEALPAAVQRGGRGQGGGPGHLAQLPPQEQALNASPQYDQMATIL